MPLRLRPDDVVQRPERFALLEAPAAAAPALLRRVAGLAGAASRFLLVAREADSVTLLLAEEAAGELGDLLADARREPSAWRVITFRPELPWDLVGFMAKVTAVLASRGLPLGALSTYARDHLFVREAAAAAALDALRAAAAAGEIP